MERVHELNVKDIEHITITPAKFRELALNKILTSGPGIELDYMPTEKELDTVSEMLYEAVSAGKFIDFGHWPNEFIKKQSNRGGDLYHQDALGHPFTTPWVFFHTWDDPVIDAKFRTNVLTPSIYLVNPLLNTDGSTIACDFEITAIEAIKVANTELLAIGDRGLLMAKVDKPPTAKYACQIIPTTFRFPIKYWDQYAAELGLEEGADSAMHSAASNVMEPVFTALLLLNTRGIPKEIVRASDKLNKARIKNNKPPIPPYTRIMSKEYVTTVMRTGTHKGTAPVGHHASPVAHIRIGHWRNYKPGARTFINDTLVKATPEMREIFKSSRTHYVVKE
jgi:hypothetical protein